MNDQLVRVIGSASADNLIAKLVPSAETFGIKVKAGSGLLKRGSLLSVTASGAYALFGTVENAPPSAVLADDTDASETASDATAVAYRSGNFNRNELIMADSAELSPANIDTLRTYDIILTDPIP